MDVWNRGTSIYTLYIKNVPSIKALYRTLFVLVFEADCSDMFRQACVLCSVLAASLQEETPPKPLTAAAVDVITLWAAGAKPSAAKSGNISRISVHTLLDCHEILSRNYVNNKVVKVHIFWKGQNIFQNLVAFSEYMNFKNCISHIFSKYKIWLTLIFLRTKSHISQGLPVAKYAAW